MRNLGALIIQQRWLPYRVRRSLVKRISPSMLRDHAFTTRMEGGRIFSGNVVNYIDRLIYFCGAHEKYMLRFLEDIIAPLQQIRGQEIRYMDVGANAGNHTLFLSGKVKEVYAFEPFERVRQQLIANLKQNDIDNVRVFPFGLSHENARLPFYSGPDINLGAASFHADHHTGNHLIGESEVRVGDEVVTSEALKRIDLLKADVEGYETFVLRGLSATLRKDRPIFIIELSAATRSNITGEQDFASLFPENYHFFYFEKGNRDSGAYRLAPFRYELTPSIEDVIAVPAELEGILASVQASRV